MASALTALAQLATALERERPSDVHTFIAEWGCNRCHSPETSSIDNDLFASPPASPTMMRRRGTSPPVDNSGPTSPRVVIKESKVKQQGGYSSARKPSKSPQPGRAAARRHLTLDVVPRRKSAISSSSASPRLSPRVKVGERRSAKEGLSAFSSGANLTGKRRGEKPSKEIRAASPTGPPPTQVIGTEALAKRAEEVLGQYASMGLPMPQPSPRTPAEEKDKEKPKEAEKDSAKDGPLPPMPSEYHAVLLAMRNLVEEQQKRIAFVTSQLNDNAYQPSIVVAGSKPTAPAGGARASLVLGMCNPLLDMHLHVTPDYLERWGLDPDGATLASEAHIALFEEMAKDPRTDYVPGGAGLNTIRVAQWILGGPGSTAFVGTTGLDDFGSKLRNHTVNEGVSMFDLTISNDATGTCAVLTSEGNKRSLVANLGASAVFESEWLETNAALKASLELAGLIYVTGFFLRTVPDTVVALMERAAKAGKHVCLNLSAPFVIGALGARIMDAVQHADLVFGNNAEFKFLEEELGWAEQTDGSLSAVATKVQGWPGRSGRVVVITQGSDDLLLYDESGMETLVTPRVPGDEIVDTNGAGDAFVGGFLAKFAAGGDVRECAKLGQWAASVIIRRPGCTIPPLPPGCSIAISNVDELATRRPMVSNASRTGRAKKGKVPAAAKAIQFAKMIGSKSAKSVSGGDDSMSSMPFAVSRSRGKLRTSPGYKAL
eukprot:TRINITY_DN17741_c0_g1_i1.p1 TRINITY_DN17741_c0_g1~~TRINITY_DN17741_c0_g1_i1.p1  ORF type:complete len:716 (+),score=171.15 TRINITY_DN17741_c0_g1_i1:122-2269(+)